MAQRDYKEQLVEIEDACSSLEGWSLSDWKVELKFQLDIEQYAAKKGIQLSDKYYQTRKSFGDKPYSQTLNLLNLLSETNVAKNYIQLVMMVWSNIGKEVNRYWSEVRDEINLDEDALALSEDARLAIMAYLIVQSGNASSIYRVFKIIENFVNFEHFEEAAPLSTMETAFHIILLEYSEMILKHQLANDDGHDQAELPHLTDEQLDLLHL